MEFLKGPLLFTHWCIAITLGSACQAPEVPNTGFEPQQITENNESNELQNGEGNRSLSYQATLDGYWVHYSQVSTCVEIGSSLEQYNRSLYLVHVTQSTHGALSERWEACEIDLTPVISVKAQVPEALRDSVYPIDTRGGQVVGSPPNQYYTSGAFLELWGINMEDPLIDPMPFTSDDRRVYDMDEDGEVGVTLQIGDACMAYMVQRRITHYYGDLTAADRIDGEALSVTEQLIIEASAPICKTAYQTRSNPKRSHFSRIRVDGLGGAVNLDINDDGTVDCTEVQMARNQLFVETLMITELDHDQCSVQ